MQDSALTIIIYIYIYVLVLVVGVDVLCMWVWVLKGGQISKLYSCKTSLYFTVSCLKLAAVLVGS